MVYAVVGLIFLAILLALAVVMVLDVSHANEEHNGRLREVVVTQSNLLVSMTNTVLELADKNCELTQELVAMEDRRSSIH